MICTASYPGNYGCYFKSEHNQIQLPFRSFSNGLNFFADCTLSGNARIPSWTVNFTSHGNSSFFNFSSGGFLTRCNFPTLGQFGPIRAKLDITFFNRKYTIQGSMDRKGVAIATIENQEQQGQILAKVDLKGGPMGMKGLLSVC